jgi:ferredoxin-NADP reductase
VFRVCAVRRATPSTRIVRLTVPDRGFEYRAGQWARIGPEGASAFSPYSIASAPEDTAQDRIVEFLLKLDAQERWGEGFAPPARGQRFGVRGPFGSFTFPDSPVEQHFLFIGGGTGIAPLRSMIRHACATRLAGSYRLLYSARTPDDFAYLTELRGMARRGELQLSVTATRGGGDRWRGDRGRVTVSQLAMLVDTPATLCFVCGPAAMVNEVPEMLSGLGIDRSRIRVEENYEL